MNNNSKRRKQRITALTLVMTLLIGGCSSEKNNSKFEIVENENNELVSVDGSYISSEYIGDYYVLEVYNKMEKKNNIYIVNRVVRSVSRGMYNYDYYDVFSNLKVISTINNDAFVVDDENSLFDFVKITGLGEYIVFLGLGQLQYSYEDMKEIYEVIKENYVFEDDSSLSRKRVIDYKI